ncbi:MAG: DUF1947 domain-containing protein [Candidatus Bathyarchaeia archaeon]
MKVLRHAVQEREKKALLARYLAEYGYALSDELKRGEKVEVHKTELGTLYLLGQQPLVFETDGGLRPTLLFQRHIAQLPRIVVDQGAIPYICRGADVMKPGVRRVDGRFQRGALVAVVDERFGKPIALGNSLLSSEEILSAQRGRVVKVFHFAGDKLWKLLKTL